VQFIFTFNVFVHNLSVLTGGPTYFAENGKTENRCDIKTHYSCVYSQNNNLIHMSLEELI